MTSSNECLRSNARVSPRFPLIIGIFSVAFSTLASADENSIKWERVPINAQDLSVDKTFTNTFDIFRKSGQTTTTGKATVRTNLLITPSSDSRMAEVNMSATVTRSDVSFVPIVFRLQIADIPGGKVFEDIEEDVRTCGSPPCHANFRRSYDISTFLNASHVVFVQYPATWTISNRADAPGPIDDVTKKKHIIIVPGLLGTTGNVDTIKDLLNATNGVSAQVWNWKPLWERPRDLQDQLELNGQIRKVGSRLAKRIAEWSNHHPTTELHVLSLSAGANIFTAACAAKGNNGASHTVPERRGGKPYFTSAIYGSGALSIRENLLADVKRCTGQVFNYYSKKDDTLGRAFPRVFIFFEIPVSVVWPAQGRFGYTPENRDYAHLDYQLAWLPEEDAGRAERLGNRGRHLSPGCLSPEYFKKFVLPIIKSGTVVKAEHSHGEGWMKELHPTYPQVQE